MKKLVTMAIIAICCAMCVLAFSACDLFDSQSDGDDSGNAKNGEKGSDGHTHNFAWNMISASPAQSIQACIGCNEIKGEPRTTAAGDVGLSGGIIFYYAPGGFTVEGYPEGTGAFETYTAHYLEAAPANEEVHNYAVEGEEGVEFHATEWCWGAWDLF